MELIKTWLDHPQSSFSKNGSLETIFQKWLKFEFRFEILIFDGFMESFPNLTNNRFFDFRQKFLQNFRIFSIKYSPLKTTKKVIFHLKINKNWLPFSRFLAKTSSKILEFYRFDRFFPIFPNLTHHRFFEFRQKIFTKISEFDDRDMIQTQVEKIIDVDEKNGKSKMVFLWFTIAAGHQQLFFSIFSFLARVLAR